MASFKEAFAAARKSGKKKNLVGMVRNITPNLKKRLVLENL